MTHATAATEPLASTHTRRSDDPAHNPLWDEWLLTNGLGGYAMGTLAGVHTRRYHGLLVAAMRPPVERVVTLSQIADTVTLFPDTDREHAVTLTPFHFRQGPERHTAPPAPAEFARGVDCRWRYELPSPAGGTVELEKLVHLFDGRNAVALSYTITAPQGDGTTCRLDLRPLIALRDFHGLLRRERIAGRFVARTVPGGVMCATRDAGLHLASGDAGYQPDPQPWRGIEHIWEELRGLDSIEDLYSPGVFTRELAAGETATVTVFASTDAMEPQPIGPDREARHARVRALSAQAVEQCGGDRLAPEDAAVVARLAAAADDYIVARGVSGHAAPTAPGTPTGTPAGVPEGMRSVIAGYPWFSDWGRDTMISLAGLFLVTRRFDEAKKTLDVFGRNRRRGLIPNRFDDYDGPAHYNTVDAPLWFLHAAAEYLRCTGDHDSYNRDFAPACLDIIDAYRRGTDHGIAMDPLDALVNAGSPVTQLTWMDAQRDGVTFTPRFGKAVEINALWHNGLLATAAAIEPEFSGRAAELRELADRVKDSFAELFTNPDSGGLYDRITPGPAAANTYGPAWKPAPEIRPNQIFAASLPHSPLDDDAKRGVIAVVKKHLLTPHGLRTLAQHEDGYHGRLVGSMFDRDSAYHNGTVWPWLIGPYCEAILRAERFSDAARAEVRQTLDPLVRSLNGRCPGHIAEIYDGNDRPERPQLPDGCIAQAWSVAEVLRAYALMLHGE